MTVTLTVGGVRISFQRSVKLAADAPPTRLRSFGALPIALIDTHTALIPLAGDESVWLGFEPADDNRPSAVRIVIAGVDVEAEVEANAISGKPASDRFDGVPQNYVVVPPQRWLEGSTVTETCARQFVMHADGPHQVAVSEFSFAVVSLRDSVAAGSAPAAAAGRTPHAIGPPTFTRSGIEAITCRLPGHVERDVHTDPYGLNAWNLSTVSRMRVRVVPGEEYQRTTGEAPPGPLDPASAYGGWRLP